MVVVHQYWSEKPPVPGTLVVEAQGPSLLEGALHLLHLLWRAVSAAVSVSTMKLEFEFLFLPIQRYTTEPPS
jgi:hypothetical protein